MGDPLDEVIAKHDAATACGCGCCDDDFAAYVEQKRRELAIDQTNDADALPPSAASRRGSVRYVFEQVLSRRDP
ncbi:hypothetical protein RA28_10960 [Ruegeria sp. ANG-S4]|uniref:hypothetical protein n=1 Tax=Ruegeria sp. ANG-S4 TaxID=1577904 RepID=UPI00057D10ED|nr:hypothetical protein [Ruegeria sp. ANG-S4]KIC45012.1 hypothetical protein RA28_10960 [Ruegeria sp. ANG-S4]